MIFTPSVRAHHSATLSSSPDAAQRACGEDRSMIKVRHRSEELPVPFEVATVADAMSRGVISCPPETPLRVVARMMATHGVHAIFVFEHTDEDDEERRLWAVVSDLDLVAATELDLDELTAGATAVTPLVSVKASSSIAEAGSLMAQYGIAHLAVTEPTSRRPIGVISSLDIARAIAAGHGPREVFASA
jgi:CBS domain-containing protein